MAARAIVAPAVRFAINRKLDLRDVHAGFSDRFPGAQLTLTSGVDEHNDFARYAWTFNAADTAAIRGAGSASRLPARMMVALLAEFGYGPGTSTL